MLTLSPLETARFAVHALGALQKPEEFACLLAEVDALSPHTILEIGLGNGGSSWAFSKISSVKRIVSIDLPSGPWGGQADLSPALKYITQNSSAQYHFISGNSHNSECLAAVSQILSQAIEQSESEAEHSESVAKVDFLFIDGDHSAVGVAADYENYKQFVRPGGLIAFHDIVVHPPETKCEVSVFWEALKKQLPPDSIKEFIYSDLEDSESPKADAVGWAGIGLVKVPDKER